MPLAKRVRTSPAAQKIIRDAFENLERALSADDRAAIQNTTLEDVRQAIYQIENQLAARQSLRNMSKLSIVFDSMDAYSSAIETLCLGTPYLTGIWSPMKMVLKAAWDYVEAFEKIVKAYVRITEPLTRFKIFNLTFSKDIDVQKTLAIFYCDLLKFHKEAYQFVRRNSWKTFFFASWARFQHRFDGIIDDMKAHEELVDKTVAAVNISEAKEMREKLEGWRQESLQKLSEDEAAQTSSQYFSIVGLLKLNESDQLKIFDSIASEAIANGTCSWILKQPKIQSWIRCSQDGSFVILHGHPGTGKSVLATQIASFLRSTENSLVITHFCAYSYTESTNYENILKSILLQLIRSNPDLIAYVHDLLLVKKKLPSVQVLEQLLRDTVGAMSPTPSQTRYIHIIVDGLDECEENIHIKTMKQLQRLATTALQSGSTVLKVLFTARLSPAMEKTAKHREKVSLSDEKESLKKSIESYAFQKLDLLRSRFSQMGITDNDLKGIGVRIAMKADGMFLWARLVLEYLANNMFHKRDEVLGASEALPRKLKEFYGQILTQATSHFDGRSIARMKSILGWIAFAKRPLRMVELQSALAFGSGDPEIHEVAPPYLFGMCASLIEKRRDSTFAFIHVSVRDYLQSPESTMILDERIALTEHGLAAVTCLLSGVRVFSPSYPDKDRSLKILHGIQAFQTYAMEYWVDYVLAHASSSREPDGLISSFVQLSCQLATVFVKWAASSGNRQDLHSMRSTTGQLAYLQQQDNGLYIVSKAILSTRQERFLTELPLEADNISDELVEITTPECLRLNYQSIVKKLLNMHHYPGMRLQDLEKFRRDFRTSVYVCRLWACPYATLGFDNAESRQTHEKSHSGYICDQPGCQYPPSSSLRALRRHQINHHDYATTAPLRSTIRKHQAQPQKPYQEILGLDSFEIKSQQINDVDVEENADPSNNEEVNALMDNAAPRSGGANIVPRKNAKQLEQSPSTQAKPKTGESLPSKENSLTTSSLGYYRERDKDMEAEKQDIFNDVLLDNSAVVIGSTSPISLPPLSSITSFRGIPQISSKDYVQRPRGALYGPLAERTWHGDF